MGFCDGDMFEARDCKSEGRYEEPAGRLGGIEVFFGVMQIAHAVRSSNMARLCDKKVISVGVCRSSRERERSLRVSVSRFGLELR